ncbi:hypothetical protein [Parapedobacter sp. 2B3]|uniref:hypothetical protein n=1 Tax=Parapedobacter sp. 2B3 TaxID=3342381 RepID=UPI0035B62290
METTRRDNAKATILTLLLLCIAAVGWACPVCEKQQPKVLRGVTHGAGPDSNWDYLIVGVITIIVAITLYYSMKWLLRPGEDTPNHIKRSILDLD